MKACNKVMHQNSKPSFKMIVITLILLYSTTCFAEEISIEGTGIKFNVPDEFNHLSQELIDVKWPNKNRPKWVVGNEKGTTTIAYDLKDNDISNYSMKDLIPAFTQTMNRVIPGIVWKEKKVINQSSKEWVYLEMTSNAIDTDIYNMILLTSYENRMLIFNFNSTKEEIDKYKPILLESIGSINVENRANKSLKPTADASVK